jgi:DNA-directed RNA polymerase subunit RPC12/RpoP
MKAYRCPNCGEIDHMKSVEEEVHYYDIHPDEDGEKTYTGHSNCVDGRIDFILCLYCGADFHESQLEEMVVDVEEEE